jgi:hypothetical protein
MGVRKGTDNFAKSRKARIDDNNRLITHELEKQAKRRIPYPSLSVLVADISDKTGLHRTTLSREGSPYLRLLLSHLARQPGASALVHDDDASAPLLKEKLYDARLENRTLRNQLETASRRLARDAGANEQETPAGPPANDWYLAFADTAMLLKMLIDRFNQDDETVRVDVERKQLLDLSASPRNRVVAGPERVRWFADFYKKIKDQESGGSGSIA